VGRRGMLNKIKNNKVIYSILGLMFFLVIARFTYNFIVFDATEAIVFLLITFISLCSEVFMAFIFIKMDTPLFRENTIIYPEQYKYIQNLIFIITIFVCFLLHVLKPNNEPYRFNLGLIWAGGAIQGINYIIRTEITDKRKRVGVVILSIIFCFLIGWVIFYFDK
jgi:hypothetical protein